MLYGLGRRYRSGRVLWLLMAATACSSKQATPLSTSLAESPTGQVKADRAARIVRGLGDSRLAAGIRVLAPLACSISPQPAAAHDRVLAAAWEQPPEVRAAV